MLAQILHYRVHLAGGCTQANAQCYLSTLLASLPRACEVIFRGRGGAYNLRATQTRSRYLPPAVNMSDNPGSTTRKRPAAPKKKSARQREPSPQLSEATIDIGGSPDERQSLEKANVGDVGRQQQQPPSPPQEQLQQQDKGEEGGGKGGGHNMRLRLDLNLEIELEIRARIHGDLTLGLM